jgi:hypothetical protein
LTQNYWSTDDNRPPYHGRENAVQSDSRCHHCMVRCNLAYINPSTT